MQEIRGLIFEWGVGLSIVYLAIMMKQLSESTMRGETQSLCLWDSHMSSYVNRRWAQCLLWVLLKFQHNVQRFENKSKVIYDHVTKFKWRTWELILLLLESRRIYIILNSWSRIRKWYSFRCAHYKQTNNVFHRPKTYKATRTQNKERRISREQVAKWINCLKGNQMPKHEKLSNNGMPWY